MGAFVWSPLLITLGNSDNSRPTGGFPQYGRCSCYFCRTKW